MIYTRIIIDLSLKIASRPVIVYIDICAGWTACSVVFSIQCHSACCHYGVVEPKRDRKGGVSSDCTDRPHYHFIISSVEVEGGVEFAVSSVVPSGGRVCGYAI